MAKSVAACCGAVLSKLWVSRGIVIEHVVEKGRWRIEMEDSAEVCSVSPRPQIDL